MKPIVVVVAMLSVLGCSESSTEAPKSLKAGQFALAYSSSSGAASLHKRVSEVFNIGDIKTSRTLHFILSNVGDFDVNGVQIISDSAGLNALDPGLSKLRPSTQAGAVTPIVDVELLHGKALSTTAIVPTLKPGNNSLVFHIQGRTYNGTDSVTTTLGATVVCNALVTDIGIFQGDRGEYSYWSSVGETTPSGGHATSYSLVNDAVADSLFNTGNTTITVERYNSFGQPPIPGSLVVLLPGQGMEISVYGYVRMSIDGGGAAVKSEKGLRLDADGKVYIQFNHLGSP